MLVDAYLVYSFVKRLVLPFNKWDAFKTGVIDKDGNILVAPDKRTYQQKESFQYFDVLTLNLKKLLGKLGNNVITTSAAVAFLLHEPEPVNESFDESMPDLEERFKLYMTEDGAVAVPTNSAGSGAVAGIGTGLKGEPGVKRKKQSKSEASTINNILRRNYTVNSMSSTNGNTR